MELLVILLVLFLPVLTVLTIGSGLAGIVTRQARWSRFFAGGSLFIILLLVSTDFGDFYRRIRGTEFTVTNAGADSTFYARIDNLLTGKPVTESRAGCQLFVRIVGHADDSTALQVPYFGYTKTIHLPKGPVDTVWGGDHYDSKAHIRFIHQQAKRGTFHVNVAFSYPPEEWNWHSAHTSQPSVRQPD